MLVGREHRLVWEGVVGSAKADIAAAGGWTLQSGVQQYQSIEAGVDDGIGVIAGLVCCQDAHKF